METPAFFFWSSSLLQQISRLILPNLTNSFRLVKVGSSRAAAAAHSLTTICSETCPCNMTVFVVRLFFFFFTSPVEESVSSASGESDHGVFGGKRRIPARAKRLVPPVQLVCCGNVFIYFFFLSLSLSLTEQRTRQRLPPVYALRDDVMRNLFTCAQCGCTREMRRQRPVEKWRFFFFLQKGSMETEI